MRQSRDLYMCLVRGDGCGQVSERRVVEPDATGQVDRLWYEHVHLHRLHHLVWKSLLWLVWRMHMGLEPRDGMVYEGFLLPEREMI